MTINSEAKSSNIYTTEWVQQNCVTHSLFRIPVFLLSLVHMSISSSAYFAAFKIEFIFNSFPLLVGFKFEFKIHDMTRKQSPLLGTGRHVELTITLVLMCNRLFPVPGRLGQHVLDNRTGGMTPFIFTNTIWFQIPFFQKKKGIYGVRRRSDRADERQKIVGTSLSFIFFCPGQINPNHSLEPLCVTKFRPSSGLTAKAIWKTDNKIRCHL